MAGPLAVTLLALLAVGLWKGDQTETASPPPLRAERAVDDDAALARGAASAGAGEPLQGTIEVVAVRAPLQRPRRAPAPADSATVDPDAGLLIVNAAVGNPFGLRASDVIVDLCDRPGVETALEMSYALATDASSCLTVFRDNALVRAELGAPASEEAKPARERGAGPEL